MWQYLSSLSLTDAWQFTSPFVGSFVRVTHVLSVDIYGRGLIAQSDIAGAEFFQTRKLYLKQAERHVFEFVQPVFFPARTIALKAYIFPPGSVPWTVNIEYWEI